jgi:hypothetical protein
LESFVALDVRDAERKSALLVEADAAMAHVKRGADLLAGVKLLGLNAQDAEDLQLRMVDSFLAGQLDGVIDADKHPDPASSLSAAKKERVFHWEFEFPEVFEKGGFSAFVGNPPFQGGQRISIMTSDNYLKYLKNSFLSFTGTGDLCALFFLRCYELLSKKGTFGLIATNTISQGDTRATGLDEIVKNSGNIYRAFSSMPWTGVAAVYVSIVHIYKGIFSGKKLLNDKHVDVISSLLDDTIIVGNPESLIENSGKSSIGSYVLGAGFILTPEEASSLIEKDSKNKDVLFPIINGSELNSHFDQSPSRWVINFFDWSLEKAEEYPDCIERVRQLVKPERSHLIGRNPIGTKRGNYWWQYGSDARNLYSNIKLMKRVLVVAATSKTVAFTFVKTGLVFSHALVVFAFDDNSHFSVLQSSFHNSWVLKYASSLKGDTRYTPSDCFETYPFPKNLEGLESV